MEFKTNDIQELHEMIRLAIADGLRFRCESEGDAAYRVFTINYEEGVWK